MFSQLAVSALLALPFFVQGAVLRRALPANCARDYVVRPGDFCDSISAAQNVSTFQLAHVNTNIDPACDNLAVGEDLCLGITGQDCSTVGVVASGDTCESIASGAGIPFSTLLANNPNVDDGCTNIGIGEVLCTASQIFNYTTTA